MLGGWRPRFAQPATRPSSAHEEPSHAGKADIEREARWYDAQQPGLGTDFVDEVKRVIGVIAEQPLRYSIRFGHWRRANLQRFPHAVYYQVIEGEPIVFAVLHAKRDHGPILETRRPTV